MLTEDDLQTVWPDGWVIFQYVAIKNNENLSYDIRIGNSIFQILSNIK